MTDDELRDKLRKFTYTDIELWGPSCSPDRYLAKNWEGTVLDILENKDIPFEDRLWVILRKDLVSEKLMRLFAVWCARQVQHLMSDGRSLKALDVAEAFANGQATKGELDAAWDAARYAARHAARHAARAAAWAAALDAARAAAWDEVLEAAWAAALDAQETKLREMLVAGIKAGDVCVR